MSAAPTVVVRKGGFLSPLFHGVFGFLTVVVVCASGLGFYALHIANTKVDGLFDLTSDVIGGLPEWQRNLPPLLGEILDDRRAPEYRQRVDVRVRTAPSPDRFERELTVVEVANNGPETISVLALNIVLENEDGVPVFDHRVYAATPVAADEGEWRGLLFPEDTRRFVVCRSGHECGLRPTVQVAELRVWNGPRDAGSIASDNVSDADEAPDAAESNNDAAEVAADAG
jgi:hypothetical protein